MSIALDSASRLSAIADKKAGYTEHGRYLTGPYAMDAAEVASATAEGIGVFSIFERIANRALSGSAGGKADALTAIPAAHQLRQPEHSSIVLTVDFDPDESQMAAVEDYLLAGTVELRAEGLSMPYGGTTVMQEIAGKVDHRWQAGGWSNGVAVSGVALRQGVNQLVVGGVDCDVDEVLAASFGAWNLDGVFPHPNTPAPKPAPLTADQYAALHGYDQIDRAEAHEVNNQGGDWYRFADSAMHAGPRTEAAITAATLPIFAATAFLKKHPRIHHAGP